MKFCPECGKPLAHAFIDGRPRKVCPDSLCGYIYWNNPTPVVAGVVEWNGGVILVRSRGWPQRFFGIVAGFLEAGETPEEGILREVAEELGLTGRIVDFLGHYDFPEKNQTIAAFHVRAEGTLVLGHEIAEAKVLPPEQVKPWNAGTGPAVKEFLRRRTKGDAMEKRVVSPGEQLVFALYVRDVETSCRFFQDLGFHVSRRDGPFAELRWEDSLLFVVERHELSPPAQPVGNIRVMVSDVDAVYKKVQELGYAIVTPLEDRYYGLRDFIIKGPDGVDVRFAAPLSTATKEGEAESAPVCGKASTHPTSTPQRSNDPHRKG
ncbi:NUDIX domain-containing protein [Desulfosoma caldarium]|uniref:Nudix hydrolase family protein n=1 Tax=Desulfosoma caldarium TaxID=610254 RepID=A0A3N1UHD3_9BACT|nr:NUDIX domain-containing protein [Desulfosoma caldarium]ROQ90672.1 nudix hydrolase family protein [Desulfosoma caldarium]